MPKYFRTIEKSWKMIENRKMSKKLKLLFCTMYKFHNSHFVILVIFVNFLITVGPWTFATWHCWRPTGFRAISSSTRSSSVSSWQFSSTLIEPTPRRKREYYWIVRRGRTDCFGGCKSYGAGSSWRGYAAIIPWTFGTGSKFFTWPRRNRKSHRDRYCGKSNPICRAECLKIN